MMAKSSLSLLILAMASAKLHAGSMDKTPWKPLSRSRANARQYHPSASGYSSQAYSGPQHSMTARPVTYVPPAVTFNPPRLVYNSPSVTRAVSTSSSSNYRQNYVPSSMQNYGNMAYSSSYAQPSYAAPVQPNQYQLVSPSISSPYPPMSPHTISYQLMPQHAVTTPAPSQMQYQLIAQPSNMARSYAAPPQYQLLQQPSGDAPPVFALPNSYTISTVTTSTTPSPLSTTEATTPAPSTAAPTTNSDNATFVDVVTVMAKYFRATGTQLTEMFTQLSNSTELNAWGYGWTTPTTTTTPPPTPAPPPYQPPVVVVHPIMMPSAPAPPQPTYTMAAMPPPPPPSYSPPQPLYHQPQPSFSHLQPTYAYPPPMYSQSPPSFHQPTPTLQQPPPSPYVYQPPSFPGKNLNMEIMDNSIDHDYYYDCDKK